MAIENAVAIATNGVSSELVQSTAIGIPGWLVVVAFLLLMYFLFRFLAPRAAEQWRRADEEERKQSE